MNNHIEKKKRNFLQDNYVLELTFFYFKKIIFSYWFYLGVILIPFLFCLCFLTQLPSFLLVDSTIAFPLIFNILFFYGIIFFNFRRSHFYILVNQKFNNKKIMIYLPIFFNLIIIAFLTFVFSLFFIFLFEKLDWLALEDWSYADSYYYQISKIVDYRWGLLIYYITITFLVTFMIAILLQTLSLKFNSYLLLTIILLILIIFFSGTVNFTTFVNPYSNHSDNLLYSYNQDTHVLTFKPYFDKNDPNLAGKSFFSNFSIRKFLQMINPYYYITTWGQFDIFIEHYRTTTLVLDGIDPNNGNQIIIDETDPSTWVQYHYVMFSFTNWLWSSYIFSPYIFILFYVFLVIFIDKRRKNEY
ncbi:/ / hypothetical protein / 352933:353988 Reverse [Candidatus Hepatoplasma crinochetorum]|uniref:Uncharacterized protein n=1 Tax=Candidatus Hepatoplasma crinochetorum TaxID=295596 RepID=A0A0G7ZMQ6_9MOLU|nr:/ / hypothetical protein / 352933:353988 Reverse [Candidatus Hepatoplasma crinochetorum]